MVRDHFRAALIGDDGDAAVRAADLLTGALIGEPRTIRQVRTVVHAIQLLLEAGQVAQADELYRERLDNGYFFVDRALPREGLECALLFVADAFRKQLQQHSARRRGYYLNTVGVIAMHAAELELAEQYLHDAVELFEQEGGDDYTLWSALLNLVDYSFIPAAWLMPKTLHVERSR